MEEEEKLKLLSFRGAIDLWFSHLTLRGLDLHACTGSNSYSIGPLFNFRVASLPAVR